MIWLLLTWLAAPFLLLRANWRRRPVRRVLVIQTAKIGDFVATTPVFRALSQQLPGCEITALLHPINVPLAEGLDSIDHIVPLRHGGYKGWTGKRWLLGVLADGYDGVLILSPNLANLLAPLWCGIARRVSVLPDRRQGIARLAWPLLSHGEAHHNGRTFRDTALHALAGFGLIPDAASQALPNEATISAAGRSRCAALLKDATVPLIGLGLGAGNRMKALAPEQLRELATLLTADQATLVLIGTTADQEVARQLVDSLPGRRLIDTTGQWGLADLPALLCRLNCFVGVDSGATYLADAVGVPVVDFMGPADAGDQRPVGESSVVITSPECCAPCSHTFDAPYSCRLGSRACMTNAPIPKLAAVTLASCRRHETVHETDEIR